MVLSLETSHRPTSSLSSPVFLLLLFLLPHFVILLADMGYMSGKILEEFQEILFKDGR
jgi:hypothetical protein